MSSRRLKIIVAVSLIACASEAHPAEKRLSPTLTLSEEYNDNILGVEHNRDEDYITRVLPGLTGFYRGPRLSVEGSYSFDYRYFAKRRHENIETHVADLSALGEIARNIFFLKLSDSYDRVSIDPSRESTRESLVLGQTDANIFTAEPYFTLRPSSLMTVNAGYRYINTWYKEEGAADKEDNVFFLNAEMDSSERTKWYAGAAHTDEKGDAADFKKYEVHGGLKHEYGEGSALSLGVGNSWLDFEEGRSYSSVFWNASVEHGFGAYKGTISTSARFIENPGATPQWEYSHSAGIAWRSERTALRAAVYLVDYEDSETEDLATRKYGTTLGADYKITERLAYTISGTAEKYEKNDMTAHTRRLYLDQKFDWSVTPELALAFTYNFIGYHSPEIAADNYQVNRFIAELRAAF